MAEGLTFPAIRPLLWVAGGRTYDNMRLVKSTLVHYHEWTLITGGATGADWLAEQAWRHMRRPLIVIPARWEAFGRSAGPLRNLRIAEQFHPDLLIAFPGGAGTDDAIRVARVNGIEVMAVE